LRRARGFDPALYRRLDGLLSVSGVIHNLGANDDRRGNDRNGTIVLTVGLNKRTSDRVGGNVTVGRGELAVEVEPQADVDAEELAQLTNRLRIELLGLDVDAVQSTSEGEAPDSSKGIDLLAAGRIGGAFPAPPGCSPIDH
jgi:hypothetical protein